jgi:type IV pilus assembly protein PilO
MATPGGSSLGLSKISLPAKIGFGIFLVIIVAAGYYLVLHTDVTAKTEQEVRKTKDLEGQIASLRQAEASYIQDREELAMRQQKQRELNKILPADTEAAAFLSAIQQVSNISGINLKAWQPRDEVPSTFYAKVPMQLELTGKFHQIGKFMFEIGKQDRIINLENVELAEPKTEGEDVILKARCLATTFHLLKAKPATAQPGQTGQPGVNPQPFNPNPGAPK